MAQVPNIDVPSKGLPPLDITIQPAQLEDVEPLAAISGAAFETDTHTQLKSLFDGASAHADGSRQGMESWVDHPKVDFLVAKEAGSGRVLGSIAWCRRGYEGDIDSKLDVPPKNELPKDGPKTIKDLKAMTDRMMQNWAYELLPEGCRCRYIINATVDTA